MSRSSEDIKWKTLFLIADLRVINLPLFNEVYRSSVSLCALRSHGADCTRNLKRKPTTSRLETKILHASCHHGDYMILAYIGLESRSNPRRLSNHREWGKLFLNK